MNLYRSDCKLTIGKVILISSEKGLCFLSLPGEKKSIMTRFLARYFPQAEIKTGGRINTLAARQLREYLTSRRKKFSVPIDLRVSGFSGKVLGHLKKIPCGKTMTYGQVARAIGRPRAFRAVGAANAANPLPIIVPCHRVVAVGGLGGYGGGLPLKKKLLRLEGAKV